MRRAGLRGASGAALPLVLLLLLALTALSHGAFLVSLEEQAASRASAALLQARLMAEAGVRRALQGAARDTLPEAGEGASLVLAQGAAANAAFRVELRRLAPEVYWMEGLGSAALADGGRRRVEDRLARLLWALSPLERVGAFGAVVEYGGELEAVPGAVEAWGAWEGGAWDAPAGCRDRRRALDSLRSSGALRPAARVGFATAGPLPELGLLGHDTLLARLEARVREMVRPAPVTRDGRCLTDAAHNWGSPSDPGGPCGGHRPAVASDQDLTLAGGEGQGLLLVGGNLRLTEGAHYAGLVLVGGDLLLEGAARLEGLARVRGSLSVREGALVSGAVCSALLALEAAPALRRPIALPASGWIRPF